jgi:hypothetical protein
MRWPQKGAVRQAHAPGPERSRRAKGAKRTRSEAPRLGSPLRFLRFFAAKHPSFPVAVFGLGSSGRTKREDVLAAKRRKKAQNFVVDKKTPLSVGPCAFCASLRQNIRRSPRRPLAFGVRSSGLPKREDARRMPRRELKAPGRNCSDSSELGLPRTEAEERFRPSLLLPICVYLRASAVTFSVPGVLGVTLFSVSSVYSVVKSSTRLPFAPSACICG